MSTVDFERLRGLIVEDNAHMRTLLRALLQSLGIRRVHEAADGAAGLLVLREHVPDFVLTDLSMKPMDGIEFTKKIRLGSDIPNPLIPIIMITGFTERARVEAARDAGVSEFLAKPITMQNLQSRLFEISERPRPFIRCATYCGPDRRRRRAEGFAGPWRRHDDRKDDIVIK